MRESTQSQTTEHKRPASLELAQLTLSTNSYPGMPPTDTKHGYFVFVTPMGTSQANGAAGSTAEPGRAK